MVRICVVGAGAAGLSAGKLSLEEGHDVLIYEQNSKLGGTWVYSPETGIHSSMYEDLKTNLPKEAMLFQDRPFRDDLPSFLTHSDVLEYLIDYGNGLPILYNHTVKNIQRIGDHWKVTVLANDSIITTEFDVVFVCNGHYFTPRIDVDIAKFSGTVIHSHDYRNARGFAHQQVAVVGAASSGIDIAIQVATLAEKVVLIGRNAVFERLPSNIVQKSLRFMGLEGNSLLLENGDTVTGIDSIILCTGYKMKFPFLSNDIISINADGQMISPLYEHVVHVMYPRSIFFIGFNLQTVTFTLFEHQVKLGLAFVSGKVQIPSNEDLNSWEKHRLELLCKNNLDAHSYHVLGNDQWDYLDHLADIGKFPRWRYHSIMRKIYDYVADQRKIDIVGYKNINFEVHGEEIIATKLT